jgi:cell division protein ZapB
LFVLVIIDRSENKMNSDFDKLAEKIHRLADLATALRLENVQLRRTSTELTVENKELRGKMQEAHDRVEAVLEQLPKDKQENAEQSV